MGSSSASMEFDGKADKFMRTAKQIEEALKRQEKQLKRTATSSEKSAAASERANKRLAQSMEDLANKVKKIDDNQSRMSRGIEKFGRIATRVFGTVVGSRGFGQLLNLQDQFDRKLEASFEKFSTLQRRFVAQSGMTQEQTRRFFQQGLFPEARRARLPNIELGEAVARELQSQGVSLEDIKGGGLFEIATGALATNVPEDPESFRQFTRLIVGATRARKLPLTPQGFKRQLNEFFNFFADEPAQPEDLPAIASTFATAAKFGVDPGNVQAFLLEERAKNIRPSRAATGLNALILTLSNIETQNAQQKILEGAGIDSSALSQLVPSKVGGLPTALRNLQALEEQVIASGGQSLIGSLGREVTPSAVRNIETVTGGRLAELQPKLAREGAKDARVREILSGPLGALNASQLDVEKAEFGRQGEVAGNQAFRNQIRAFLTRGGATGAGIELTEATIKKLQSIGIPNETIASRLFAAQELSDFGAVGSLGIPSALLGGTSTSKERAQKFLSAIEADLSPPSGIGDIVPTPVTPPPGVRGLAPDFPRVQKTPQEIELETLKRQKAAEDLTAREARLNVAELKFAREQGDSSVNRKALEAAERTAEAAELQNQKLDLMIRKLEQQEKGPRNIQRNNSR